MGREQVIPQLYAQHGQRSGQHAGAAAVHAQHQREMAFFLRAHQAMIS